MKITIVTDLHLEFDKNPTMKLAGGDVLLLPGDVAVAKYFKPGRTDKDAKKMLRIADPFFKEECAKFDKVFYIMGNHEHYHNIFDYTVEIMREYLAGTNVTILDKEWADLNEDWQIFGGTLWTDYNNNDWFARHAAQDKMNDHTIIKKIKPVNNPYGKPFGRFLPTDAYDEHKLTLKALEEGIYDYKRIDRKTIVMTHHAPTAKSVHPRFGNDLLNYAYFTNLEDTILDHPNIKYWFHGHTHDGHDYMVGDNCRVICNPRGYAGYEVNAGFDPNFTIEI